MLGNSDGIDCKVIFVDGPPNLCKNLCVQKSVFKAEYNYLLTYDSYVPLYNRFHRGEWIMRVSGGRGPWTLLGP
jgi:hypothetical protein